MRKISLLLCVALLLLGGRPVVALDIVQGSSTAKITFPLYATGADSLLTGQAGNITLWVSKNGTDYTVGLGTLAEILSPTATASGTYRYTPTATETNTTGDFWIYATCAGASPATRLAQITAYNPADGSLLGLTGIATLANQTTQAATLATNATAVTAVKAKTDLIATNGADSPNAQTGQTSAATAATQATTAATQASAANGKLLGNVSAQTGDAYARLGAPAGASTAADIAAVKTSVGTPVQVGGTVTLAGTQNFNNTGQTTKQAATLNASDVTGNVNANLVSYLASGGSITPLPALFTFPNGALSTYAGGPVALSTNDEAVMTSLLAMITANKFTASALSNGPQPADLVTAILANAAFKRLLAITTGSYSRATVTSPLTYTDPVSGQTYIVTITTDTSGNGLTRSISP